MTKIIGRLVNVGLGIESSRGTGVAPGVWLPQTSLSLAAKVDEARSEGALGSLADSEGKLVTEKYAEGEIAGEVRDQSIGYFLYALLGAVNSSASGAGYSHAFSLSEGNQHKSLTIVEKSSIASDMYKMAMLNKFELTVGLDGLAKFTAGVITKKPVTTTQTYTRTAENKFSKKHANIYLAANIAGLGAATALDIKSLTLSVEKSLQRDSVIGTEEPIDIVNKAISITGSITLNYEDNTIRNYMMDGTYKALRIKLSNTDVDLGGGLRPSLTIDLSKVDFSGWEPNYALEDIVSQTINFKASYDLTNGLVNACTLVNAKANYTA